ncbi:MAG: hypothetical protein KDE59_18875, partial [Anaerolineales bacterium]|nr:hypothetical protein [Anaerolineales bacterium]
LRHLLMSASPALAAANARLLCLRAASKVPGNQPPAAASLAAKPPWEAAGTGLIEKVLAQPDHLGWGSEAATVAIRQAQANHRQRLAASQPLSLPQLPHPPIPSSSPSADHPTNTNTHIPVIPDLAFGMLKQGLASQGRLWLLMRHLDESGRGWHLQGALRHQMTKTSYRFCGRRQLANLLKEGEGIFWRFGSGRIWLLSTGKVAANLGLDNATYRPVAMPVKAFLGKVGQVRAHFYATYHSARAVGDRPGMPVARETIAAITGVDPHSQRSYEKLLNLDVRQNIAIGEEIIEGEAGQALAQERAWRHGNALFTLTDYKGKQGAKGRRYHAWQLPNSYGAIHAAESRGGRRRLNRQLIDLQKKGAGNDRVGRRYFANGKQLERSRGLMHVDRYCPTGRFGAGETWSVWSEGIK